jgi:hypothetical protein
MYLPSKEELCREIEQQKQEEATGALPAVHTDENTLPSYECSVANYNSRVDVRVDDEIKTEQTAARESARIAEAREKEQQRKKKHDAKVAALHKEVPAMNKEVPSVIVSILDRLSLGDQRVYHAIRRYGGIQAQNIAEVLPYQECVERPSLATIKRSISALTKAGLIIREGSKKTGQYIITKSIL